MKTIKEWLKEGLKKEHYKIAKKNKSYDWNYIVNSFKYAMDCGVRFSKDNPVWNEIYINNGNRKKPKDLIVDEVRKDLLKRSKTGIKKYNTTLDRTDLSLLDWHQHHYEELLDAALYTKRIIKELKNKS